MFVGTLPADQNVSNTGFNWAGRRWTTGGAAGAQDPVSRAALMMHERWLPDPGQPRLSPPRSSTNDHLDTGMAGSGCDSKAARQRALVTKGEKRRTAAKATRCFFRRYSPCQLISGADSSGS